MSKETKKTGGLTASDYVFVPYPDEDTFGIAKKSFWEEEGHLFDCGLTEAEEDLLPKGFINSMESVYEYARGDFEQGRQALLAAGFTEVHEKE